MMMQQKKGKIFNEIVYKDKKSQVTVDDAGEYGEHTLNINFQFSCSSIDWILFSNSHIKKIRERCEKILSDEKKSPPQSGATKGDIFKKKDVLILGCACIGGIRSHLLVIEKLKDEDGIMYETTLHSGCKSKTKKGKKYLRCDEIILDKRQIKQLLEFMKERNCPL